MSIELLFFLFLLSSSYISHLYPLTQLLENDVISVFNHQPYFKEHNRRMAYCICPNVYISVVLPLFLMFQVFFCYHFPSIFNNSGDKFYTSLTSILHLEMFFISLSVLKDIFPIYWNLDWVLYYADEIISFFKFFIFIIFWYKFIRPKRFVKLLLYPVVWVELIHISQVWTHYVFIVNLVLNMFQSLL